MNRRRLYLTRILKLMTLLGAVFISIPFISQVTHDEHAQGRVRDAWEVEIDLRELEPGQFLNIDDWPGGPVSAYRRTDYEIRALQQPNPGLLDPDSRDSRQPPSMGNPTRSQKPEYFVFIPQETQRQCRVRYIPADKQPKADIEWYGGFSDPCLGSLYDSAGRIYAGYREAAQQNLTVPPYRFVGRHRIQLEPWKD